MSNELIAYIDGNYIPESSASISISDSGFLLGDVVTESTRTFGLRPFRLKDHMIRLERSLKLTQIKPDISMQEIEEATLEVLERNRHLFGSTDDVWLVHNISRGIVPFSRRPSQKYPSATVVIHCYPIDFTGFAAQFDTGVHVVIPSTRQIPTQCVDPKIKHRSRMHMNLASLEAKQVDPEAYPVLLDIEGNLSENTGGNFFVVSDGVVKTPDSKNALEGVSRATVIELCKQLGIPVSEEVLQPYDAYIADEAFLTSTPYCMIPATKLNGQPINDGTPGPITNRLLAAWSELIGLDIVGQAQSHLDGSRN